VPYNLVEYSEQFDNASWNKLGIGGALAPVVTNNAGAAPNGSNTADRVQFNCVGTTSTFRSLLGIGSIVTSIGAIYTQTLYVKAYSPSEVGKQLRVVSEGTNNSAIITITADWQRIVVNGIPAIFTSSNFNIETRGGFTTNKTADVLLWGAQIVEGTDALPYQLTETRLNRPRVDFSLGGCPSLLLEPQRTNLVTWSEDFSNVIWSKSAGVSISTNSAIAPNGLMTADIIDFGAFDKFVSQATTATTGVSLTGTFYIKGIAGQTIQIAVAGVDQLFTLDGTWQRLGHTRTTTGTVFGLNVNTFGSSTARVISLWGAQLEANAYPTTYIPTSSASVTRNQDTFQLSNVFTNNMISSAGGTWFVDFKGNVDLNRSASAGGLFLNTGTISLAGDGFLFRNPTTSSQKMSIIKYNSGTPSTLYNTLTENVKAAIKWNGTTADVFVNGVKVVSATAFTATNMENLIGQGQNRTLQINSMALWNTPLTDDELEVITGEGFDTYALMASNYNYILQ
jgi:hypothetical protein